MFTLISKATQDAIWDWDLTPNEAIWNEALLAVFGYPTEDVGRTASWWYENIHPDDRDSVVEGIHAVIDADGNSWSDEYRFKCKNGEYKVVYDRGFLIHHSQGKSIRMLGSMQDITERKRFEKSLKESEERFRAMADNIPNLAWMADADGWIFWYNKKWYHYTGTSPKDMEGWARLNRKDEYEGTGRGLALCKKIVERHNGKIRATGKPGEGATIQILFPIER